MSDLKPSKEKLRQRGSSSFASHIHPNPKLYKYLWQVFSNDCAHEGEDFFLFEPELSTAAFIAKIRELDERGEPYTIHNRRVPRRFEGMPFDPTSERWRDQAEWAPAWEDDPDPVYEGFK